jgi:hypothetical protein
MAQIVKMAEFRKWAELKYLLGLKLPIKIFFSLDTGP